MSVASTIKKKQEEKIIKVTIGIKEKVKDDIQKICEHYGIKQEEYIAMLIDNREIDKEIKAIEILKNTEKKALEVEENKDDLPSTEDEIDEDIEENREES